MAMRQDGLNLALRLAMIKDLQTMSSPGNVDQLVQLLHGRSGVMIVDLILVILLLEDPPLLGLEIVVKETITTVAMLITEVRTVVTTPRPPAALLLGNKQLLPTQQQQQMRTLATLLPATPADTHLSKLWVPHLDLQHLLD